jgi:hypothetical protein
MSDIKTTVAFRHDIDSSSMRGWDGHGNFVGEATVEQPAQQPQAKAPRSETYTESMAGIPAFQPK